MNIEDMTRDDEYVEITTTLPANNLKEIEGIIDLALYGYGELRTEQPRKHTIIGRGQTATSYNVEVSHKGDGSVRIKIDPCEGLTKKARGWLAKIFQ